MLYIKLALREHTGIVLIKNHMPGSLRGYAFEGQLAIVAAQSCLMKNRMEPK